MIETSEKYKRLFEEGAIQEYRLTIDDKEYNREDIYDNIEVSQNLFSKETFSVGDFVVDELNTKLKVDSKEIPANAKVKFEYRYVGEFLSLTWYDIRNKKWSEM